MARYKLDYISVKQRFINSSRPINAKAYLGAGAVTTTFYVADVKIESKLEDTSNKQKL